MIEVSFRLDDLYNTEATVTLPDERVITVRTLTDAEVNLRDLASLEASSVVEEQYSDEGSEDYKSLIGPIELLDPPDLIAIIMAVRERFIGERVNSEHPFRYIPFPDKASEEEKREVLTRRRESEAKVIHRRSEEKSATLIKERTDLEELDDPGELLRRAKNSMMNTEMFTARVSEFYAQTVYLSCTEDGDLAFDLETLQRQGRKDGLNAKVFNRLLEVYGEIDIADPWILEKHP